MRKLARIFLALAVALAIYGCTENPVKHSECRPGSQDWPWCDPDCGCFRQ